MQAALHGSSLRGVDQDWLLHILLPSDTRPEGEGARQGRGDRARTS